MISSHTRAVPNGRRRWRASEQLSMQAKLKRSLANKILAKYSAISTIIKAIYLIIFVALTICNIHIRSSLALQTKSSGNNLPKFKIVEAYSLSETGSKPPVTQQSLALEIKINETDSKLNQAVSKDEPSHNYPVFKASKASQLEGNEIPLLFANNHNSNSGLHSPLFENRSKKRYLARKRPYDVPMDDSHSSFSFNQDSHVLTRDNPNSGKKGPIDESTSNNRINDINKRNNLFYSLEPELVKRAGQLDQQEAGHLSMIISSMSTTTTKTPTPKQAEIDQAKKWSSRSGQRSELIRTQHRPPWMWTKHHRKYHIGQFEHSGNKFRLKLTTIAPNSLTTAEIFKLISSAHSPIKLAIQKLQSNSTKNSQTDKHNQAFKTSETFPSRPKDDSKPNEITAITTQAPFSTTTTTITTDSITPLSMEDRAFKRHNLTAQNSGEKVPSQEDRDSIVTAPSDNHSQLSLNNATVQVGHNRGVMSPAILVRDGDETDQGDGGHDGGLYNQDSVMNGRRQLVNHTITRKANQIPVTIIRHSKIRPVTMITSVPVATSTEAPGLLVIPNKVTIQTIVAPVLITTTTTRAPRDLVRLIAKQKHRYDDNVTSSPLTVIDNDAFRLPQNTTAVHNNRLLVRIKPGQQQLQRIQLTTEYPYYNPVAGITPPYPSGSATTTRRPVAKPSSNYGLINSTTTPVPQSNFGAPNIKFTAPVPSTVFTEHLDPPYQQEPPLPPDRLNITVSSDANIVGPNKVPDKIFMESEERPPLSSLVISDTTLVGRPPYGSSTINQDGIIRLSTTRRPRPQTTKRINIVSANTTIVTTSPNQLNDVLSSVISSHQQDNNHHVNQNQPPRPGFFATIAQLFNSSVATTVVAVITVIKTILVAILIMFLPPIALTAAIVQAVSLG